MIACNLGMQTEVRKIQRRAVMMDIYFTVKYQIAFCINSIAGKYGRLHSIFCGC